MKKNLIKNTMLTAMMIAITICFFRGGRVSAKPSHPGSLITKSNSAIQVNQIIENAENELAENTVTTQTWKALKNCSELLTLECLESTATPSFETKTSINRVSDLLETIEQGTMDGSIKTNCFITDNDETNKIPEKEWLVLIYSVTDGFLSETVQADINEMETVGSTKNIEVLMQMSTSRLDNVRYRINNDNNTDLITSQVVDNLGDVDCGNWSTLDDFVKWGMSTCKAKRVFLILQNCVGTLGYGAPEDKISEYKNYPKEYETLLEMLNDKDYSKAVAKENGARYMGTRHLGNALEALSSRLNRPIDVLGLDDSSNCSIEKFYEYKNWVNLYIGSAGYLPTDNWPYDKILTTLDTKPEIEFEDLGKSVVEDFEESYKSYCNLPFGFGATLSCLKLSNTEKLMDEMKRLSEKLYKLTKRSSANRQEILKGREKVLDYFGSSNMDLGEWVDALSGYSFADEELKGICSNIRKAMDDTLIALSANGRYYKRSTGMSITVDEWFGLWGSYDCKKYKNLQWCKYSNWIKFLLNLYKEI